VTYKDVDKIKEIIDSSEMLVIVQADNPDADSLGSALALEQILAGIGKKTYLYCAVDMPGYLHYLPGWDRVNQELPSKFDASIIVDASTLTLFEKLIQSGHKGWLASKPCIVLDHHESVENPIDFSEITINDSGRASAGELIYYLAKQLGWALNLSAQEAIMCSILGDTQGLSNQLAKADTYRVVADLIDGGVNRPALEEIRREFSKMPQKIFKYKAELIKRSEFFLDGSLALIMVPQKEINEFSPLYNPAPLIQSDLLQTLGVRVAVVIKVYDDGRITGAIRSIADSPVASKLAKSLGGGGHEYASGFKVVDGRVYDDIKKSLIDATSELLKSEASK
jgi:phosphoesterase RecJ-like protein